MEFDSDFVRNLTILSFILSLKKKHYFARH